MTKRDRIVLIAVAVVAVVGGFYMTVLKPTRAELATLGEQVDQAVERRDTARAALAAGASARAAYRRDTATLALLGKAVPGDDGVPSLLYQVEGAARQAGVDFASVSLGGGDAAAAAAAPATGQPAAEPVPGTTAGPEGLQAMPLKIKFEGTFFRLERFLTSVHRFARVDGEALDVRGRLVTIDNVALTPGGKGLPRLTAEITATAYVAPAEAAAAGAAAPGTTAGAPAAATTASTPATGK
jgi:Tfp pilus assembly protein PilO